MLYLGVSGKSVLLYGIVFTCRYLDLFIHFVSVYNSTMKIIYLVATYFTIYLIYKKFKSTYDRNHDSFRIELLILPSAALAFIWNHEFSVLEVRIEYLLSVHAGNKLQNNSKLLYIYILIHMSEYTIEFSSD